MIVPPPQGGDRAVHHGHGGRDEEAEDVDGSEEGTVRLRCQVPQVGCCIICENKIFYIPPPVSS